MVDVANGWFGPMLGQNHHFSKFAPERIPYAIERYVNETKRLYGVLNKQLIGQKFVAGEYSIADMAICRGRCVTIGKAYSLRIIHMFKTILNV
jgi:glutathione S-transferase